MREQLLTEHNYYQINIININFHFVPRIFALKFQKNLSTKNKVIASHRNHVDNRTITQYCRYFSVVKTIQKGRRDKQSGQRLLTAIICRVGKGRIKQLKWDYSFFEIYKSFLEPEGDVARTLQSHFQYCSGQAFLGKPWVAVWVAHLELSPLASRMITSLQIILKSCC